MLWFKVWFPKEPPVVGPGGKLGHWRIIRGHRVFIPVERTPKGIAWRPSEAQHVPASWEQHIGAEGEIKVEDQPVAGVDVHPANPNFLTVMFQYDPKLVERIRQIKGRQFDPVTKSWYVPLGAKGEGLKELIKAFGDLWVSERLLKRLSELFKPQTERERTATLTDEAIGDADRRYYPNLFTLTLQELQSLPYLTQWEKDFIADIAKRRLPRARLTEKQIKTIESIQRKHEQELLRRPDLARQLKQSFLKRTLENLEHLELLSRELAGEYLGRPVPSRAQKDEETLEIDPENFTYPQGFRGDKLQGGDLFPHQKRGVAWLLKVKRGILAFATGLGKTYTVITAAALLQDRYGKRMKALFVVPKARLYGTLRDIQTILPDKKVVVLTGSPAEREKLYKEAQDADFVITTYGLLRQEPDKLQALNFGIFIADEVVRLKGRSEVAKVAKQWFGRTPYIWGLSATPFPNSPEDLYNLMELFAPHVFKSFKDFRDQHCLVEEIKVRQEDPETGEEYYRRIQKIVGYKNLSATRKVIEPYIMARTYDSPDVTINLPKKFEVLERLDMDDDQARLYAMLRDELLDDLAQIADPTKISPQQQMIVLTKLLRLEEVALMPSLVFPNYKGSSPKIDALMDILQDHMETSNRAAIVYCHRVEVLNHIAQRLRDEMKMQPSEFAVITGSVPAQKVQEIVDGVNSGRIKVLLASDAAAEGLNLQYNTDLLIHLSLGQWRPDIIEQREGRVYRPGQTANVTILTLIMNDTIEERKWEMIRRKAKEQAVLVHGEEVAAGVGQIPTLTYEEWLHLLGVTPEEVAQRRRR